MNPRQPKRKQTRRDRLTTAFQNLVPPIARHYAQSSPEAYDDLQQVGLLGLLRAAERYSPGEAVPFERFARPHIRGAILHHLRDSAWLVRLPRRQAELQQQLGRCSSAEPAALDIDVRERLERWSALVRPLSLEAIGTEGLSAMASSTRWDDECEPGRGYQPEALDPAWNQRSSLQMLNLVQPRQRRVLHCVVLQGWSYRRTGAELSISAATVQRLLHQGLAELRLRLSAPTEPQRHRDPSAARAS